MKPLLNDLQQITLDYRDLYVKYARLTEEKCFTCYTFEKNIDGIYTILNLTLLLEPRFEQ